MRLHSRVERRSERSTPDDALAGHQIDKTFTDKASGKDVKRPQLQAALDYLRDGDVLVCHSMDRLARNMRDLYNLIAELNGRGVAVEFVKERLSFSGEVAPMSKLLLGILGSIAEFERALIKERQKEGIAAAKSRGVYKGRKKVMSAEQVAELRKRIAAGESKSELARVFGVSRQTIYMASEPNYLNAEGNPPAY